MLEFEGLTKTFPGRKTPAVTDLDLEVRDREILGLVGLNGAGKTTTIRVAAGVSLPSRGTARVEGYDVVREKSEAGRRLGWVSEFPNFEPNARTLPLLRYRGGFFGLSGTAATARGRELLELVDLPDAEGTKFRALSQGMKKRFGLAWALMGDPDCILLDEVLNGLDPEGVRFLRQLMVDLRAKGKTVLLSSHILNEVQQVADRVAILHRGRLVKVLSREEMATAGSTTLRLRISNLDEAALEHLRSLGQLRRDGNVVWLTGGKASPEDVTTDLVRRGYRVAEVSLEAQSLETLFFQATGGEPTGDEKTRRTGR